MITGCRVAHVVVNVEIDRLVGIEPPVDRLIVRPIDYLMSPVIGIDFI
jgi:hypothetical protein